MTNYVGNVEYHDGFSGGSADVSTVNDSVPSGLLTLPYYFTSKTEMERLFSTDAIEYRRDDFNDQVQEKANVLQEVIVQATSEAKAILNAIYDDIDLQNSPWVRRRTTAIGCYLLSIRLGNDAQYYNEYLDALGDFQDAVNGLVVLGIPTNVGSNASMVNIHSDNRFPYTPIRADTVTSTDERQGINYPRHYIPYYWI